MGRLIDADEFLKRVKKDREHEIYLHSWTADMVLKRLDSWYAPTAQAIPKADYKARLKADMVAMLEELQKEIDAMPCLYTDYSFYVKEFDVSNLIQEKINALKAE